MLDAVTEFERLYVRPKEGRTLIAGSYITENKADRRARFKNAVGVDMRDGPGVDLVLNLEQEHDIGTFSHVDCCSVLEHVARPWLFAKSIERMMEPGATIYVGVPFNWRAHSYPDDYFRMTTSALKVLFENIEWKHLRYATYKGLIAKPRLPWTMYDGHRFYARSVTCGFGIRR